MLQNQRLRHHAERAPGRDYPGGSTYRVLFDFYARNQVPGTTEDLHFNATYRAREGERAAVRGYPIFVGLGVDSEGVPLRFHTINVKNDADEAFLDSLRAMSSAAGSSSRRRCSRRSRRFPAWPWDSPRASPSAIATSRSRTATSCFTLRVLQLGARLALGDYIAVQIPESLQRVWDRQDWVYEPRSSLIVFRDNPETLISYNYVALGVSRYEGE